MGRECVLMLLALLAATAVNATQIDQQDIEACVREARVAQRYWRYEESLAATKWHVGDAANACRAFLGDSDGARQIFQLYGSMVGVESDWRFILHDHGVGLGWIGCQRHEVWAAAKHLGYGCGTDTEREAVWVRFGKDRTFAAWIECRHVLGLVEYADGDWRKGLRKHNGGRHYKGDVLEAWYSLWAEPAPVVMEVR